MAYMSQERKAKIAAGLKAVMPEGWKYSLAVRNHSTIVLTISEAPINLVAAWEKCTNATRAARGHVDVNVYHLDKQFEGELLATFEKIKAVMMEGNHDRSDIMTDYFDVGWYIDICIGKWDKPFKWVH